MKYYRVIVYMNGKKESMIMNAHSKCECFFILSKIYNEKLEVEETAIIIKDLTYEEKKLYKIIS